MLKIKKIVTAAVLGVALASPGCLVEFWDRFNPEPEPVERCFGFDLGDDDFEFCIP